MRFRAFGSRLKVPSLTWKDFDPVLYSGRFWGLGCRGLKDNGASILSPALSWQALLRPVNPRSSHRQPTAPSCALFFSSTGSRAHCRGTTYPVAIRTELVGASPLRARRSLAHASPSAVVFFYSSAGTPGAHSSVPRAALPAAALFFSFEERTTNVSCLGKYTKKI